MRSSGLIIMGMVVCLVGFSATGCSAQSHTRESAGAQIKQGTTEIVQGIKQAGSGVGHYTSDTVVTSHVKVRLAANQGLSSFSIHVKTEDGVVILTGKVDHSAQRDLAGSTAAKTSGVKYVDNRISVSGN